MLVLAVVILVLGGGGCFKKAEKSPAELMRESIAAQMGQGWAVVIGIEKYQHADPVKFAVADAQAVGAFLTEQGYRVTALYDDQATSAAMVAAVEDVLAKRAGQQDRVVVFFAGRGETRTVAGGKQGFLLPISGEAGTAAESGVGIEQLRAISEASPAHHVLFLIQASAGGIAAKSLDGIEDASPEALKAFAAARGRQMITAAEPDQLSVESKEWRHGIFTHYLLTGLQQGQGDLNHDGVIPASELYAYLAQSVADANQIRGRVQRPQFVALSDGVGELLFLAQPGGAPAAPPDMPVMQAIRAAEQDIKVLESRLQDLEGAEARGYQFDEGGLSLQQQLDETRKMLAAARERYRQARLQAGHEVLGQDGAPMVLVPAGEFSMGEDTTRYSVGDPMYNYAPPHKVYLETYYIDKYEVTTAHYAKFLDAEGRPAPRFWNEVKLDVDGNRPVIGVTWDDAQAYCQWAGKRLPTEAEWEKAARGTDGRKYPWGSSEPTRSQASYDWYGIRSWQGYGTLSPVGSFEAGRSPYGVYDLAGNVWEWVADRYDQKYYLVGPKQNPKGPEKGKDRVVRGGSWRHPPELMRAAYRHHYQQKVLPFTYLGFRCAQGLAK
jgi:formylglycine-generating enzyme required for sulfatase activity